MELKEKAAFLCGLAEGLDYDKTTKEGKLLAAIIDLLAEITDEIEGLNEDVAYLSDYADELDKDLGDVEADIYGDDDDDFDGECDGDCENCDLDCGFAGDDEEEPEDDKN